MITIKLKSDKFYKIEIDGEKKIYLHAQSIEKGDILLQLHSLKTWLKTYKSLEDKKKIKEVKQEIKRLEEAFMIL